MSSPSHATPPLIPVLIPSASDTLARQLAQQHPLPEQVQHIYRNLIAVFALKHYLELMGIATDLTSCDCWNAWMRLTLNRADIELVGYGRLECCLLQSEELDNPASVMLPQEWVDERLGYVAIQVEGEVDKPGLPQVLLVGFMVEDEGPVTSLNQLRSMFELPEFLAALTQQPFVTQISHWFQHQVKQGWQTLEEVLKFAPQPQLQMRGGTNRAEMTRQVYGKSLLLSNGKDPHTVALIADVVLQPDGQYAVELRVCPVEEEAFLPPGLEMVVLDAAGELVMQAQTREQNRMIELGFLAEVGDRFQLNVRLGEHEWIESFVV